MKSNLVGQQRRAGGQNYEYENHAIIEANVPVRKNVEITSYSPWYRF